MSGNNSLKPTMASGAYHTIRRDVEDTIDNLEMNKKYLEDDDILRLRSIIGDDQDSSSLSVDEIHKMYSLVKMVRDKVLDKKGELTKTARVQDISSLVSSINSLVTLYMRHQATLDHVKQVADLKEAVVTAMRDLPVEVQATFYDKLSEIEARK